MRTQDLQYYLHDEWNTVRFELAGTLAGDGAQKVYQAWRTALSIVGDRPVIVDITFVVEADERGRALLRLWHQNGARIIAGSPESRALAEPILGEALPALAAKQGWLQWLRARLLGRPAPAAVDSALAENRHAFSASAQHERDDVNGVSDARRLECRVR